jgi:hypothetical protein
MPALNAYPLFFVVIGFVASTLLYERALKLMDANAKAALIDASARTRLFNLAAIVVFLALVLWRPLLGWTFLGCAYLCLGIRSFFRLRRLALRPHAARLLLMGNVSAVLGVALCAFIFVERGLR